MQLRNLCKEQKSNLQKTFGVRKKTIDEIIYETVYNNIDEYRKVFKKFTDSLLVDQKNTLFKAGHCFSLYVVLVYDIIGRSVF